MGKGRLWVVEMCEGTWWEPTVGVALTRGYGREVLAYWQARNPHDRFRLRPYEETTAPANRR